MIGEKEFNITPSAGPTNSELDMLKVCDYLDRIDRVLFPKLDTIGKAAEIIFDMYPPPIARIDDNGTLQIRPKTVIGNPLNRLSKLDLTPQQQRHVERVLAKIQAHETRHKQELLRRSKKDLILDAWQRINHTGINDIDAENISNGVSVVNTPLNFLILIHGKDTERRWGINNSPISLTHTLGLYAQDKYAYITTTHNKIDLINGTIAHEYLHFLYRHFVKRFIPPQTLDTRAMLQKMPPQEQMLIIRQSDYYETRAAMGIFEIVRDELVAYAYGSNKFEGRLNSLVPKGETFYNIINEQVENPHDREKLLNGMQDLQSSFRRFLRELPSKYQPRDVGYIIISSENLMQMARRIRLFIDANKSTTK